MPLYDYKCNQCQIVFEVRASFKEKEVGLHPECPGCKSPDTQQLITAGLFLVSPGGEISTGFSGCGPSAGPGCCGG
jgi:putative FmdB family regulatory protein